MAVDRKKLLAELKKAKERMGKIRFLKKNTVHHLRVLEFLDADGDVIFARNHVGHKKVEDGFTAKENLCRAQTLNKPCAYCQVDKMAREEGETSPYKFRNTYLLSAIDIDAADKKVAVWSVPTSVYNAIAATLLDDDYVDVLEPKTGSAFTIKREGEGLETRYDTRPMRNAWPVSAPLLKGVKDPLEVIDDPGLDAQLEELGMDKDALFDDGEALEQVDPVAEPSEEAAEPSEESAEPSEESTEEKLVYDEFSTKKLTVLCKERGLKLTNNMSRGVMLDLLEENDSEPSEETGLVEEGEPTTKPGCFGDTELFVEDSECATDCGHFKACKLKVAEKLAAAEVGKVKSKKAPLDKSKKKTSDELEQSSSGLPRVKGKRGRPKGSKAKADPAEKTTTKTRASKLLGK